MPTVNNDAAIMSALVRQMTRAVERQTVAASNLANLDTPGYHAREVSFASELDSQLGALSMTSTDPGHLGGPAPSSGAEVGEAGGLAERRDGNNVQLDRELLGISKAAADFSAAQAVLAAKFRLVRYAINDGK